MKRAHRGEEAEMRLWGRSFGKLFRSGERSRGLLAFLLCLTMLLSLTSCEGIRGRRKSGDREEEETKVRARERDSGEKEREKKKLEGEEGEERVLYFSKDGLRLYSRSLGKSEEVQEGSWENGWNHMDQEDVQYTEDGKYLYYIEYESPEVLVKETEGAMEEAWGEEEMSGEAEMEACCAGVNLHDGILRRKTIGEESAVKKIAEGVESFQLLSDGSLLYIRSNNRGIYLFTDGEKEKLYSGTPHTYFLSKDEKTILFLAYEGEGTDGWTDRLFALQKEEGGEWKLSCLSDAVWTFYGSSESMDRIYYSERREEDEGERIFKIENFGEPEQIDGGAEFIYVRVDSEGNLCYIRKKTDEINFLAEDDLSRRDSPEIPSLGDKERERLYGKERIPEGSALYRYMEIYLWNQFVQSMKDACHYAICSYGDACLYDGKELRVLSERAELPFITGGDRVLLLHSIAEGYQGTRKLSELYEEYLSLVFFQVYGRWPGEAEGEEIDLECLFYDYFGISGSPLSEIFLMEEQISEDDFNGWKYSVISYYAARRLADRLLYDALQGQSYRIIFEGREEKIEEEGILQDIFSENSGKLACLSFPLSLREEEKEDPDLEKSILEARKGEMELLFWEKQSAGMKRLDQNVTDLNGFCDGEIYYMKDQAEREESGTAYCSGKRLMTDIQKIYISEDRVYLIGEWDGRGLFDIYLPGKRKAVLAAEEVKSFYPLKDGGFAYIGDYRTKSGHGKLCLYRADGEKEELSEEASSIYDGVSSEDFMVYG